MSATPGNGNWSQGRNRSPADLAREGDRYRADMDETLNEIEQELSPGKLLDRSMQYFRDHGGDFIREAGATVRNNPLPVLLTAAGVVWLTAAVASSHSSSGSQTQRRWRQSGGHLDEDMASFDEFADGQGYAGSSSSSGRIKSALSQGQAALSRGESQLAQLVREQPIALGAVALAAGALLGAALPITDYENRIMRSVGNDGGSTGTSEEMMDE